MAIHAVLVKRDEQVNTITHVGDFFRTRTNSEKSVPAANDGLICVVGVEVETSAAEDLCENVAWRSYSLAGCSSDTDSKGLLHHALTD